MERQFEKTFKELKTQLEKMAQSVELAIEAAIVALTTSNKSKITEVYELEKQINRAHVAVDGSCMKALALQHPFAADLRLIIAIIKINTDLERMGDQSVNIAHNTERYIKAPPLAPLVDLPIMFDEVRAMVHEAIDAFVLNSEWRAREVLKRDDKVDALKNKIFKDVLDHIKAEPSGIEQGLNLILIARNLERIGDHATNIAEDVIFAITGEDVRHAARAETIRDAIQPHT